MGNNIEVDKNLFHEKTSVEEELEKRVLWFIFLRWFAIVGILTGCGIAWVLKIQLLFPPFLYTAGIILTYNLIYLFFLRWLLPYDLFVNMQICIDWLALTILVHYSGGIESPLIFYFIFHVIIASILLSRRACFLQVTVAFLLIAELAILEFSGLISHVETEELVPFVLHNNMKYVLTTLFFIASALYVSAYLATSITSTLRKERSQ